MNLHIRIAGLILLIAPILKNEPKYIVNASSAPPDAPGRGIRFAVNSTND